MGTPDSTLFTTGVAELAKEMAYGHLGGDVMAKLGLDRMLLELKLQDHILPVLADLGGFEPLENQFHKGVETSEIWKDAMEKTPLRDTRCVRLTSHGIQVFRQGKPVFSLLMFLTRKREWITALSEHRYIETLDYRPDDWQRPRDFVHHANLEVLCKWVAKLTSMNQLDRLNKDKESFEIMLAQALDDLLRRAVRRRRETLEKLEAAELGGRMQNIRVTGYQYINSTRDYCMQQGFME